MKSYNRLLRGALVVLILTIASCAKAPPSECLSCPDDCHSGHCVRPTVTFSVPEPHTTKADVLFMVDNSSSMGVIQTALSTSVPSFVQPFVDLAKHGTLADLHVGVVTSDYGAGPQGAPGCAPSPGPDEGRLQRQGKNAKSMNCGPGGRFIEIAFDKSGNAAANNLPMGKSFADTFACMAAGGEHGCGFEHSLESVYAALTSQRDNYGFLRSDALLLVVFVSNHDDGSAPPESDVFDVNRSGMYGFEDRYSRETRFAVMCEKGGIRTFPPYADSGGALFNCAPAPNYPSGSGPGKQYDVSRYINLFTSVPMADGLKANPLDVILVGIDAPEEPFQVILSNPATPAGQKYTECAPLDEMSSPVCVPVLQHSCINSQRPEFFGDPAVRLNAVVKAAERHAMYSVCDADYSAALTSAAKLTVGSLVGGCLMEPVPLSAMGDTLRSDCRVDEVFVGSEGTETATALKACAATGATTPCWKLGGVDACQGVSTGGLSLTVDRGGATAPAQNYLRVTCVAKAG